MRKLLAHDWPAATSELPQMLNDLTTVHSTDFATKLSASDMRARVLPAGVAIVAGFADCGPESIYGSPSGIRLGLIRQAFGVMDQ